MYRNRLLQTLALVMVLGAGLLWRSRYLPMSPFFSKYGGDALWALAVFLGAGLCFRHASTWRITLIALGFAWGIEFSQLYHVPWLDQLRSSLPGRLVLGSTFNAPDLLAYVLGIAVGAAAERACSKRQSR
ncbi:MAG: DUF2809 domain-containing protein [Prosthecobacter sp.]|uniref:ribosomal maturation YjgA family protein n=1 Tax=Prosthecobacter sp. TaxID=1965333 RepID=UPI002618D238|nr:DUF2809 domain-containing protein [Prosthecobacter sp.]MCF7789441.1 DUF2809 domain-containing protein [Prosthecobacter sp.]